MNEPQGQQPTKTSNILPWLRFWCNLGFYVIFLISFIIGGCCLIKNTRPLGYQPINDIMKDIKENTKQKDDASSSNSNSSSKNDSSSEENDKTNIKSSMKYFSLKLNDFYNTFEILKVQHLIEQQKECIASLDNFISLGAVELAVEKSVESHLEWKGIPECYIIKRDDYEKALKDIALASRQEVSEEYHKSFSILITILTIFGIGFPIIIALVQHSFNDRDLDKIENTATKADEAIKQVNSIKTEANQATQIALTAANESTVAAKNAKQATDDATKAINDANKATIDANKSLNENEERKSEIVELSQTFNDEIKLLDALFSAFLRNQDQERFHNIRMLIDLRYILYNIKGLESKIINEKLDFNNIKETIAHIIKKIDLLLKQINLLKDDDEIINAKLVRGNCIYSFNRYLEITNNIKNNLPTESYEDINKLNNKILEAIKIVFEINKKSDSEDK